MGSHSGVVCIKNRKNELEELYATIGQRYNVDRYIVEEIIRSQYEFMKYKSFPERRCLRLFGLGVFGMSEMRKERQQRIYGDPHGEIQHEEVKSKLKRDDIQLSDNDREEGDD